MDEPYSLGFNGQKDAWEIVRNSDFKTVADGIKDRIEACYWLEKFNLMAKTITQGIANSGE